MKRVKTFTIPLLVYLFLAGCSSRPQTTITDLLIHFEKSDIDVETNPVTPQEKEAFQKTLKKLLALEKKYPFLAKKAKKRKRPYEEMKVVALDGLRVIIYRYKNEDKARQAYERFLAREEPQKKRNEEGRHPLFPRLKYTYLQHGPFLIKIPHWKPKVTKGRLSLLPPSVTEINPDPATVEKIKEALESFNPR